MPLFNLSRFTTNFTHNSQILVLIYVFIFYIHNIRIKGKTGFIETDRVAALLNTMGQQFEYGLVNTKLNNFFKITQ
jgi:hypothetical protein